MAVACFSDPPQLDGSGGGGTSGDDGATEATTGGSVTGVGSVGSTGSSGMADTDSGPPGCDGPICYRPPITVSVMGAVQHLALADFDNDGLLDVAYGTPTTRLGALFQANDGFNPGSGLPGADVKAMVAGDFVTPSVASVAIAYEDRLEVYRLDGTGTSIQSETTTIGTVTALAADRRATEDGLWSATTQGNAHVIELWDASTDTLVSLSSINASAGVVDLAVRTFDGMDTGALATLTDNQLVLFSDAMVPVESMLTPLAPGPTRIAPGRLETAVGSDAAVVDTSGVTLVLSVLAPGMDVVATPMMPDAHALAVGDADDDGFDDVIAVAAETILVARNDDGVLLEPVALATGSAVSALAAGDVNGDGRADIVAGHDGSISIVLSGPPT